MTKKSLLLKTGLIAVIAVALFVVPANSSLIFGYGTSSSSSSPACNDQKPDSAPVLLSATSTGLNSITLNWAKANNPVSYYLVTFGTKPGEQLYGNPNVGGSETTSYTVNSLSGGRRYYFKVRGGNGCTPGNFSNEVSAVSAGGFIAQGAVPGGFAPGVLGAQTHVTPTVGPTGHLSPTSVPSVAPTVAPTHVGFFQGIWGFIKGLFGK